VARLACVAAFAGVVVGCRSIGHGGDTRDTRPEASTHATPQRRAVGTEPGGVGEGTPLVAEVGRELAAFAGGCFWGVEDTFRQVPGVVATAVGYTGGRTENPTYEAVCSHGTGHAEAVLLEFEPKVISYPQLLRVFFANHDPTTRDRQGPDVGDQYRSAIFTFGAAQAEQARAAIATENAAHGGRVVTRVSPVAPFYKAEAYHQQYDEKTGTHSCPLPKGLPGGPPPGAGLPRSPTET